MGRSNAEKGMYAEEIVDSYFFKLGYKKLPTKFSGNQGIDACFVNYSPSGKLVRIHIIEVKFSRKGISYSLARTKSGIQISKEWIWGTLERMLRFGEKDVKDTVLIILQGIYDKIALLNLFVLSPEMAKHNILGTIPFPQLEQGRKLWPNITEIWLRQASDAEGNFSFEKRKFYPVLARIFSQSKGIFSYYKQSISKQKILSIIGDLKATFPGYAAVLALQTFLALSVKESIDINLEDDDLGDILRLSSGRVVSINTREKREALYAMSAFLEEASVDTFNIHKEAFLPCYTKELEKYSLDPTNIPFLRKEKDQDKLDFNRDKAILLDSLRKDSVIYFHIFTLQAFFGRSFDECLDITYTECFAKGLQLFTKREGACFLLSAVTVEQKSTLYSVAAYIKEKETIRPKGLSYSSFRRGYYALLQSHNVFFSPEKLFDTVSSVQNKNQPTVCSHLHFLKRAFVAPFSIKLGSNMFNRYMLPASSTYAGFLETYSISGKRLNPLEKLYALNIRYGCMLESQLLFGLTLDECVKIDPYYGDKGEFLHVKDNTVRIETSLQRALLNRMHSFISPGRFLKPNMLSDEAFIKSYLDNEVSVNVNFERYMLEKKPLIADFVSKTATEQRKEVTIDEKFLLNLKIAAPRYGLFFITQFLFNLTIEEVLAIRPEDVLEDRIYVHKFGRKEEILAESFLKSIFLKEIKQELLEMQALKPKEVTVEDFVLDYYLTLQEYGIFFLGDHISRYQNFIFSRNFRVNVEKNKIDASVAALSTPREEMVCVEPDSISNGEKEQPESENNNPIMLLGADLGSEEGFNTQPYKAESGKEEHSVELVKMPESPLFFEEISEAAKEKESVSEAFQEQKNLIKKLEQLGRIPHFSYVFILQTFFGLSFDSALAVRPKTHDKGSYIFVPSGDNVRVGFSDQRVFLSKIQRECRLMSTSKHEYSILKSSGLEKPVFEIEYNLLLRKLNVKNIRDYIISQIEYVDENIVNDIPVLRDKSHNVEVTRKQLEFLSGSETIGYVFSFQVLFKLTLPEVFSIKPHECVDEMLYCPRKKINKTADLRVNTLEKKNFLEDVQSNLPKTFSISTLVGKQEAAFIRKYYTTLQNVGIFAYEETVPILNREEMDCILQNDREKERQEKEFSASREQESLDEVDRELSKEAKTEKSLFQKVFSVFSDKFTGEVLQDVTVKTSIDSEKEAVQHLTINEKTLNTEEYDKSVLTQYFQLLYISTSEGRIVNILGSELKYKFKLILQLRLVFRLTFEEVLKTSLIEKDMGDYLYLPSRKIRIESVIQRNLLNTFFKNMSKLERKILLPTSISFAKYKAIYYAELDKYGIASEAEYITERTQKLSNLIEQSNNRGVISKEDMLSLIACIKKANMRYGLVLELQYFFHLTVLEASYVENKAGVARISRHRLPQGENMSQEKELVAINAEQKALLNNVVQYLTEGTKIQVTSISKKEFYVNYHRLLQKFGLYDLRSVLPESCFSLTEYKNRVKKNTEKSKLFKKAKKPAGKKKIAVKAEKEKFSFRMNVI